MTSQVLARAVGVLGVVTETGEIRLITAEDAQLFGNLAVTGPRVSAALTAIKFTGSTWPDNSSVGTISINGSVAARATLSGSYTGAGDRGTFSLNFDAIYDRDSALANTAGTWVVYDAFLNILATLVIDANGTINGSDVDGCIYAGSVSIIDSRYNIYDLALTVANCPPPVAISNGVYDGVGVLADEISGSGDNDRFTIGVSNSLAVVSLTLIKL